MANLGKFTLLLFTLLALFTLFVQVAQSFSG